MDAGNCNRQNFCVLYIQRKQKWSNYFISLCDCFLKKKMNNGNRHFFDQKKKLPSLASPVSFCSSIVRSLITPFSHALGRNEFVKHMIKRSQTRSKQIFSFRFTSFILGNFFLASAADFGRSSSLQCCKKSLSRIISVWKTHFFLIFC